LTPPHKPHKEPEDIFLPLSPKRYAEFYALEMDSFTEDIRFYKDHINEGSQVLELGCGTGRICRTLSEKCMITGLDLSLSMLTQGRKKTNGSESYVCMDMCRMAFRAKFDHILIPYNTLNLLRDERLIARCLDQTRTLLKPQGTLLFQLYIPSHDTLMSKGKKVFQFQRFPLPEQKGHLIKETLRSYDAVSATIRLEERYRVRPTEQSLNRKDLSHVLYLAGFSSKKWKQLFSKAGFNPSPLKSPAQSVLLAQTSLSC
jgi:ubiquinone/menaquinone biosynthesis C-methylase UbiE